MFPRLADLGGAWQLSRQIDHADGTKAQFAGQALFTPDEDGLIYRERGALRLPQSRIMHAERTYLWRAGQGAALDVLFDDGRPFHSLAPDAAQAVHWCDPDTYKVEYLARQRPAQRLHNDQPLLARRLGRRIRSESQAVSSFWPISRSME